MPFVELDFETRSEVDLELHGSMAYMYGKHADIVMLGYKIDGKGPSRVWLPGDPLPDFVLNCKDYTFFAFNAIFDYRVWNILGKRYGFPKSKIRNWIDVMALCGRFTLPQSLAKVGAVLKLKMQKEKIGKSLIKKICTPPFTYNRNEFNEFIHYCKADVDTMSELTQALPASRLTVLEQQIWELTVKINNKGLPVDLKSCDQIIKVIEAYKLEQNAILPKLSGNTISKATQTKRIKTWLHKQGVKIPNLQAATVEKYLAKDDIPLHCRTMLTLRQELGSSSTAKFLKIQQLAFRGRVFDNLRYYGANTGRWSGMGFQLHNLPRSKVKDAEPLLKSFFDLSVIEQNPVAIGKTLVRSMIKASPGKIIVAADFASVEYVILSWVTHDERALRLFREGLDQYIDMAMDLYNKPYEDITEDERQFGKVVILGCGYGLGGKGFQANAADWNIKIDLQYATRTVNAYRTKYRKVRNMWYACARAAINAINNPGRTFSVYDCKFRVVIDRNKTRWLQLTLPSGRNMYYCDPEIGEGLYGPEVNAMGINPYTKKWMRLKIIPGRFVENIVQAVARDILAHGKLTLDAAGFNLIGSVHDEPIAEEENINPQERLDEMCKLICLTPSWAKDLPLKAEGFYGPRYRKF